MSKENDTPAIHASDCAVHNEPAYPAGPCDCHCKSSVHPTLPGATVIKLSLRYRRVSEEGPDEFQWADETEAHFGPIFDSAEAAGAGMAEAFRKYTRQRMEASA